MEENTHSVSKKVPRRSVLLGVLAIVLVIVCLLIMAEPGGGDWTAPASQGSGTRAKQGPIARWWRERSAVRRSASARRQGIRAYKAGDWEEAARELGRAIPGDRGNVSLWMMYAEAQLNRRPRQGHHIHQAMGAYREVLRLDKANAKAAKSLVEFYLGNPLEAVSIADRFLRTNHNWDIQRLRVQARIRLREFRVAYDELKAMIRTEPNDVPAYNLLGLLIEQRPEEFEEDAQQWFDQAVSNNPDTPLAYINRAVYLMRHHNSQAAAQDLDAAARLDPSDHTIRLNLAQAFIALGKKEEAEQQLNLVQKDHPEELALWYGKAQLADSNDAMLAVAEGSMAHLGAKVWDFYPTVAELFVRAGVSEKAEEIVTKMREKDYRLDLVAYIEGLIAYQKGEFSEAVVLWQRSLQLGNKSRKLRSSLASALGKIGDQQARQDQLRALVSENPNRPELHLALAQHLGLIGDWVGAREQAMEALSIDPNDRAAKLFSIKSNIRRLAARGPQADQSEWDAVEQQVRDLFGDGPTDPNVQLMLSEVLLNKGELVAAEQCLAQIKTDVPEQRLQVILSQAAILEKQNKNGEAVRLLKDAVAEFSQERVLVNRLVLLLQQNQAECEQALIDALARFEDPGQKRDIGLILGSFYQLRWEEPSKAFDLMSRLDQTLPDTIQIKRFLLTLRQVAEDKGRAQSIIDQIIRIEGEGGWQWRYEQARFWARDVSLDDRGEYARAVALLENNLITNPDDQTSRVLLAFMHERAGEMRQAMAIYGEALRRTPDDPRVMLPALFAMQKANELDKVDQLLDQLARLGVASEQLPDATRDQFRELQMRSHLRHGQMDDAKIAVDAIRGNDPNNPQSGVLLANLLMRQNKLDEAGKLLEKLHSRDPNLFAVDAARVELLVRQAKPQEALALCNEIVSKHDNTNAYMLRARTFATLGDTTKTQDDYTHLTEMEPNNPVFWATKSSYSLSTGHVSGAVNEIDKALALDPQSLAIQRQVIRTYILSGDPNRISDANGILDKALQLAGQDPDLLLDRVSLLQRTRSVENMDQSLAIIEQLTDAHPEKRQAWSVWGQLLLQGNEVEKAIITVIRGLISHPNDRTLLLLKARAEFLLSPGLAAQTYEGLLEQNPDDIAVQLHLASMYILAEATQNAVDMLVSNRAKCPEMNRQDYEFSLALAWYKNGEHVKANELTARLRKNNPDDPRTILVELESLLTDNRLGDIESRTRDWMEAHPSDDLTVNRIATRVVGTGGKENRTVAVMLLREVLTGNPESAPCLLTLARILHSAGGSDELIGLYKTILRLDPGNIIAENNLALLSEGSYTTVEFVGADSSHIPWTSFSLHNSAYYPDISAYSIPVTAFCLIKYDPPGPIMWDQSTYTITTAIPAKNQHKQ
jgi:predicted Zn-dependent protease